MMGKELIDKQSGKGGSLPTLGSAINMPIGNRTDVVNIGTTFEKVYGVYGRWSLDYLEVRNITAGANATISIILDGDLIIDDTSASSARVFFGTYNEKQEFKNSLEIVIKSDVEGVATVVFFGRPLS